MKKTALVIGNSNYKNVAKLKNPINDSKDIKNSLQNIGFNVVYCEDISLKEFNKKVKSFSSEAAGSDVLFFYYAGHGLQYNGDNYLVPVDADIEDSEEISTESINLNSIEKRFATTNSKANIFILDSCRDNPFANSMQKYANSRNIATQINRGLANTTISISESLIAFATSPNEVALDNPTGRNGLFTKSLLKHIGKANLTIQEILDLTGRDIVHESNDKQRPWIHNSIFKTKAILNTTQVDNKNDSIEEDEYPEHIVKSTKKSISDTISIRNKINIKSVGTMLKLSLFIAFGAFIGYIFQDLLKFIPNNLSKFGISSGVFYYFLGFFTLLSLKNIIGINFKTIVMSSFFIGIGGFLGDLLIDGIRLIIGGFYIQNLRWGVTTSIFYYLLSFFVLFGLRNIIDVNMKKIMKISLFISLGAFFGDIFRDLINLIYLDDYILKIAKNSVSKAGFYYFLSLGIFIGSKEYINIKTGSKIAFFIALGVFSICMIIGFITLIGAASLTPFPNFYPIYDLLQALLYFFIAYIVFYSLNKYKIIGKNS